MTQGEGSLGANKDLPPSAPLPVLAVRFLLELAGLTGFGYWGWQAGNGGIAGAVLAATCVAGSAAVWGLFRVRHDPPGKTNHPVIVPGSVRLTIELAFFGMAGAGWWLGGSRVAAETLWTMVVLVYVVTWDRQRWLLRQ